MAAAGAGTIPLAAHQVILGIYFVFVMFSEPTGQMFQAFLPDAVVKGKAATRGLVAKGLKLAGALSLLVAGSVRRLKPTVEELEGGALPLNPLSETNHRPSTGMRGADILPSPLHQ
eukprot:scaffold2771_cov252-Pinguiococcus_pyrenoidosus.AAC.35